MSNELEELKKGLTTPSMPYREPVTEGLLPPQMPSQPVNQNPTPTPPPQPQNNQGE